MPSTDQRVAVLLGYFEGQEIERLLRGALMDFRTAHGQLSHRMLGSLVKRLRGQLRTRVRELLDVSAPPRFDPWKQHCATCACRQEREGTLAIAGEDTSR